MFNEDCYGNISSLQDFEHKNVQYWLSMGLSFMLVLTNNTIRIRTSTSKTYIKLNNKFYSLDDVSASMANKRSTWTTSSNLNSSKGKKSIQHKRGYWGHNPIGRHISGPIVLLLAPYNKRKCLKTD